MKERFAEFNKSALVNGQEWLAMSSNELCSPGRRLCKVLGKVGRLMVCTWSIPVWYIHNP